MNTTLVAFDLETTGTDPQEHEAIEIGAVMLDSDGTPTDKCFFRRLRIERPESIEPGVLGVFNHYSEDGWKDAASQHEGWSAFRDWLAELPSPAVFLGSSVGKFDVQFLLKAAKTHSLSFRFDRHTVDISAVFRITAATFGWEAGDCGLKAACAALGIEHTKHHHALHDAEQAAIVYATCLQHLQGAASNEWLPR